MEVGNLHNKKAKVEGKHMERGNVHDKKAKVEGRHMQHGNFPNKKPSALRHSPTSAPGGHMEDGNLQKKKATIEEDACATTGRPRGGHTHGGHILSKKASPGKCFAADVQGEATRCLGAMPRPCRTNTPSQLRASRGRHRPENVPLMCR